MFLLNLQGGDATALVGGTAVLILMVITLMAHRNRGLEQMTSYLIEGFMFGFRVFGPVVPIAAFFYLGDAAFTEMFSGDALLRPHTALSMIWGWRWPIPFRSMARLAQ